MPELPEVETVARALREGIPGSRPALVGRVIRSVEVLWPREIGNLAPRSFARRVSGLRVDAVARHGKYLLIALAPADASPDAQPGQPATVTMLVHLKMSGRLDVVPREAAFGKHARVVWLLDGDLALRFDDARKFGRVWLVEDPAAILGGLGPDALDLPLETFREHLTARRGALKPLLLNQAVIAGIGNIYADEALHLASLHPRRGVASLTDDDITRLHQAIQQVLHEGIYANGASFDWVYPGGRYQENFRVYARAGQPCRCCGALIERIVIGQRSTHFCPRCQPSHG